jgi:hypothetical protein
VFSQEQAEAVQYPRLFFQQLDFKKANSSPIPLTLPHTKVKTFSKPQNKKRQPFLIAFNLGLPLIRE